MSNTQVKTYEDLTKFIKPELEFLGNFNSPFNPHEGPLKKYMNIACNYYKIREIYENERNDYINKKNKGIDISWDTFHTRTMERIQKLIRNDLKEYCNKEQLEKLWTKLEIEGHVLDPRYEYLRCVGKVIKNTPFKEHLEQDFKEGKVDRRASVMIAENYKKRMGKRAYPLTQLGITIKEMSPIIYSDKEVLNMEEKTINLAQKGNSQSLSEYIQTNYGKTSDRKLESDIMKNKNSFKELIDKNLNAQKKIVKYFINKARKMCKNLSI